MLILDCIAIENAVKEMYRDLDLLRPGFFSYLLLAPNEQPSLVRAKLTTEKG